MRRPSVFLSGFRARATGTFRVIASCAIFIASSATAQSPVSSADVLKNPVESTPAAKATDDPVVAAEVTKFEDWYFRCSPTGQEARKCEIAQVAQILRGGESIKVLALAIAPAAEETKIRDKKAGRPLKLTTRVPLNVALQPGLSIKIKGKPLIKLLYRNCNQTGCWAEQSLTSSALTVLSREASGEASLQLANGQDVNIRFSLKGMNAAVAALRAPTAE